MYTLSSEIKQTLTYGSANPSITIVQSSIPRTLFISISDFAISSSVLLFFVLSKVLTLNLPSSMYAIANFVALSFCSISLVLMYYLSSPPIFSSKTSSYVSNLYIFSHDSYQLAFVTVNATAES